MKLFYFRSPVGNFGDDLNPFLWGKLIKRLFERNDDGCTFVGIGTILDERLDDIPGKKLIFGSGISSQARLPKRQDDLDIRFVRGPISSAALSHCKWISDPGIL